MVNVNQMIKFMSDLFRIDPASAKLAGRYARQEGYLSQAGHGRGAARATTKDAAVATIGFMLSVRPGDTPIFIKEFGGLQKSEDFKLDFFDEFKPAEKLLDAIADVFTWLGDPAFARAAAWRDRGNKYHAVMPVFMLKFIDSNLSASISIDGDECRYVHESISNWHSEDGAELSIDEMKKRVDQNSEVARRFHRGFMSVKILDQQELIKIAECVNGVSFYELYKTALSEINSHG